MGNFDTNNDLKGKAERRIAFGYGVRVLILNDILMYGVMIYGIYGKFTSFNYCTSSSEISKVKYFKNVKMSAK